jgi:thiamine-phosphate pyrophosphorylase
MHRARIICYVTDCRSLPEGASQLPSVIRNAVDAGADWIQIREKEMTARELFRVAHDAIAVATGGASRVLINDRLDVALALRAAGVHLGSESAPVAAVAKWCRAGNAPEEFLIGRSCHDLDEALDAERGGASYIFFGPVFATPSKMRYGPPQGVARLGEVASRLRIPVLAIGGIDVHNAGECLGAGAAGIAAIRFFQQSFSADELKQQLSLIRQ